MLNFFGTGRRSKRIRSSDGREIASPAMPPAGPVPDRLRQMTFRLKLICSPCPDRTSPLFRGSLRRSPEYPRRGPHSVPFFLPNARFLKKRPSSALLEPWRAKRRICRETYSSGSFVRGMTVAVQARTQNLSNQAYSLFSLVPFSNFSGMFLIYFFRFRGMQIKIENNALFFSP